MTNEINDFTKNISNVNEASLCHVEELQKIGQQLKLFENNSNIEFVEGKKVESLSEEKAEFTSLDENVAFEKSVLEFKESLTNEFEIMVEAKLPVASAADTNMNAIGFISTLADEALLKEIENIPQKLAFKIGDVADMLNIKQYVLRYWETEFDLLKPKKALNNQRMYSRSDVENAYLIRKLLHRDRFSIEGAKQVLKTVRTQVKKELKTVEAKNYDLAKLEKIELNLVSLSSKINDLKKLFN